MDLRKPLIGVAAAVALVGAACGGGAEAGSGGQATLRIEQPADGAAVQVPFKVGFSSDVELGPPESGNYHVHLFFDGDDKNYEVVNGTSFLVRQMPGSGSHTIDVTLHNADHSPAGAQDSVEVTVADPGGLDDSGSSGGGNDDDKGGYGY